MREVACGGSAPNRGDAAAERLLGAITVRGDSDDERSALERTRNLRWMVRGDVCLTTRVGSDL